MKQKSVEKDDAPEGKPPFIVTGLNFEGETLSYEEGLLRDAGYLASKMEDNGVGQVRIIDSNGREFSLAEGMTEFRCNPPPGWTIR